MLLPGRASVIRLATKNVMVELVVRLLFIYCIIILKTSDYAGAATRKALLHLTNDEFRSWLLILGNQVNFGN